MSSDTPRVKVYGKAQNRTALGIVHGYLQLHPSTTLAELREAFPGSLLAKTHEKRYHHLFYPEGEQVLDCGPEAPRPLTPKEFNMDFFDEPDERISLADGNQVFMQSFWGAADYQRIVDRGAEFGITVESLEKDDRNKVEKGWFRLEFVGGYKPEQPAAVCSFASSSFNPFTGEVQGAGNKEDNQGAGNQEQGTSDASAAAEEEVVVLPAAPPAPSREYLAAVAPSKGEKKSVEVGECKCCHTLGCLGLALLLAALLLLILLLVGGGKWLAKLGAPAPEEPLPVVSAICQEHTPQWLAAMQGEAVKEPGAVAASEATATVDSASLAAEQAAQAAAQAAQTQADSLAKASEDMMQALKTKFSNVQYGSGSAVIPSDAREALGKLAELLDKFPAIKLKIVGHASADGSEAVNQRVSERRAEVAKAALVKAGIAPERIVTEGHSSREPVSDSDQALNRRTEFSLME